MIFANIKCIDLTALLPEATEVKLWLPYLERYIPVSKATVKRMCIDREATVLSYVIERLPSGQVTLWIDSPGAG